MTPLEIRDIKGFITVNEGWPITIYAGLAIVLFIALSLFYWFRRRRAEPPPPTPPHRVALEALEKLKKKATAGDGMGGQYYIELSFILREYLGDRFNLKILARTTEECLRKLDELKEISEDTQSLLKNILTRSDLSKFAGKKPAAGEIDASFRAVQLIIGETKEPFSP